MLHVLSERVIGVQVFTLDEHKRRRATDPPEGCFEQEEELPREGRGAGGRRLVMTRIDD